MFKSLIKICKRRYGDNCLFGSLFLFFRISALHLFFNCESFSTAFSIYLRARSRLTIRVHVWDIRYRGIIGDRLPITIMDCTHLLITAYLLHPFCLVLGGRYKTNWWWSIIIIVCGFRIQIKSHDASIASMPKFSGARGNRNEVSQI